MRSVSSAEEAEAFKATYFPRLKSTAAEGKFSEEFAAIGRDEGTGAMLVCVIFYIPISHHVVEAIPYTVRYP